MAKKFSFSTYDRKHLKMLFQQAKKLSDIFGSAAIKAVKIGEATGFCDSEGEFLFDNYPKVKERVEQLFTGLHQTLIATITEGNRGEWLLSAAKNDALVDSKYSRATKKFAGRAEAWHEPHLEALEAFNARKERGMNLSDRVWKLTDQFKGELELALEMGLGDGKSAADLSRDVREYLNEPHKLFRRVRNEKGQLRLSKAAAAYHPGQGVYRSSYKNALRLTATENNMAYRTADHERWNDLDFVIGIEIKLSNNHPVYDICDEMCGVYPKTFKFVGWHPFCRCIAVPKLADEDEFIARQQALIDGEDVPQGGYAGEVTEMPECFNNWVQENAERIETAKSTPYFIADNRADVNKVLYDAVKPSIPTFAAPAKRTIEEIAAERHAKRDAAGIQRRWDELKAARGVQLLKDIEAAQANMHTGYSNLIEQISNGKSIGGRSNQERLSKYVEALQTLENGTTIHIPDNDWRMVFTADKIRDGLANSIYSAADIKHILALVKTNVESRVSNLPFIKQMKELHRIKTFDASTLPSEWRSQYLIVVKGLSSSKATLKMVLPTSDETNLAAFGLNMIELSQNKIAKKFGLNLLSSKTPVQLFTEFESAIPGFTKSLKDWRSKEFFDSLKYFTPLETRGNEGCYYMPIGKFGYVHINPTFAETRLRLQSDWFKKSILTHEYGHCMFHQYDWENDADIRAVYDKWARAVNTDKGIKLKDLIAKKLDDVKKLGQDDYGYDIYEQLGKLSDSAQAVIKGHKTVYPMGHGSSYFKTYESQLNEIIAHSSENLWALNPIFKEIAPGLYKKMRELIAKKLGVKP